jgi:predicted methyltransferase
MAQDLKTLLRHPEDPRDTAVFRPQIPTDEFVLKYQKPL